MFVVGFLMLVTASDAADVNYEASKMFARCSMAYRVTADYLRDHNVEQKEWRKYQKVSLEADLVARIAALQIIGADRAERFVEDVKLEAGNEWIGQLDDPDTLKILEDEVFRCLNTVKHHQQIIDDGRKKAYGFKD